MIKENIQSNSSRTLFIKDLRDMEITLGENSVLNLVLLLINTNKTVGAPKKIEIIINGKAGNANLYGFAIGRNSSVFDFHTIIRHVNSDTKSKCVFRSVMYDSSCVNHEGAIIVNNNAHRTDAGFTHRCLLLSDDSSAKCIPSLEILTDDVQVSHAVSIGKPDEDSLFYLQSRGLNKIKAGQMLIDAFFEELIVKIPDKKLREDLRETILISLKNK
jgi:Fe-S cluster assembly protein SufD